VVRFPALAGFACILAGAVFMVKLDPIDDVQFMAVGDIMLSRNVAARMRGAGDPLLPFRNLSALLDSTDFNFGNLESPVVPPSGTESQWDGVIGGRSLVFGAPNRSVQALERYNFRVVALANNHALDQGEAGLSQTLGRLSANRIQATGAGGNLEEAWQPRIVEVKRRKIGFLAASYASLNYGTDERNDYVARIEDLDRLRSGVRALRLQASYIVVAMHAGDEYTSEPRAAQVQFARAAIDAGADVVIGSHPHWLQPVERYRGGLIFYSLGNFVFDLDSSPETREGAAVRFSIGPGDALNAEVFPIEIENSCCPRLARADEIPQALRRMRLMSRQIRVMRPRRSALFLMAE
jgi:poly-gamma-glutamate capsule biosynthesis protein CapA/YwtB (metallophosphatase superfamily)